MKRFPVLAALVVVVSLAVVLPATAQPPASRTSATLAHHVSPLNQQGQLRSRYSVSETRRGYCWTTSEVNGRLYRCFQHNFIHDPCWKVSGRHSVVCLTTPWSRKVFRIRLTKPLPSTSTYGPAVWGLRRVDGRGGNCLRTAGAGGTVGGRPITYYCHHGWVLVGRIHHSRPVWTIRTARRVGDHYELRPRHRLSDAWKPVL